MNNCRKISITTRIRGVEVGAIQRLLVKNELVGIEIKACRKDGIGAQGPYYPCCHITKFALGIGDKRWTNGSRMVAEFFRTMRAVVAVNEGGCHGSGRVQTPWVLSETFRLS